MFLLVLFCFCFSVAHCFLRPCPKYRYKIYRSVCGSDGKTYRNLCQFARENCKRKTTIKFVKYGRCKNSIRLHRIIYYVNQTNIVSSTVHNIIKTRDLPKKRNCFRDQNEYAIVYITLPEQKYIVHTF